MLEIPQNHGQWLGRAISFPKLIINRSRKEHPRSLFFSRRHRTVTFIPDGEYNAFLEDFHSSKEVAEFGRRCERGEIRDNTREVRVVNTKAVNNFSLRDFAMLYGVSYLLQSDGSEVRFGDKNEIMIVVDEEAFYREEVIDGETKMLAAGLCQHESLLRAELIRAMTTHNGKIVSPFLYNYFGDTHLRAEITNPQLAGSPPLFLSDSSTSYLGFTKDVPFMERTELPIKCDEEAIRFEGGKVYIPLAGQASINYSVNGDGSIKQINFIARDRSSTVADTLDGPILFSMCRKKNFSFLIFDASPGVYSVVTIDNQTGKTKVFQNGDNRTCIQLAESVSRKIKI